MGIMAALNIGLPSEIVMPGFKRIIGMVGTKIIYFWIIVFVCRLINKKIRELPIKQWIMIVLMPIVSTLILYIVFYSFMAASSTKGAFVYCLTVLGLLYINFAVFDFFETYLKQIRFSVLEKVIEQETENYKQIENAYNDMRKLKHDINNQINVVNALVMQDDKSSAKAVLEKISSHLDSAGAICYTGEPIIDSVINIKLSAANKLGIKITKRILVANISLDKIELCRILGNALDNAIEGCQRSDCETPHMHISIQQLDNKIVVDISNNSDNVDLSALHTKKNNKSIHGIGMVSMRTSVTKMNGYMNYYYKKGIFSINLVLPNR